MVSEHREWDTHEQSFAMKYFLGDGEENTKSSALEILQTEVKINIKTFPLQNVDDVINTVSVASGSLLPCLLYSVWCHQL